MNLITLTDAGKNLQEQTMNMASQTLKEALDGVSNKDVEMCKAVLQKVYDNLL